MEIIKINDLEFVQYISEDTIQLRVKEIALEIESTINTEEWVFVILLNGAYVFASDLLRCFTKDVETKFIKLSSYHDLESTGNVSFDTNTLGNIDGKKLFIIEDIVDTGTTIKVFIDYLLKHNVTDIKICSLLLKPNKIKHEINIDYVGFIISDLFVVGYGLDYNERGRGLRNVYQLKN
jgi:hypoxanthine phosphoribosyltransferase